VSHPIRVSVNSSEPHYHNQDQSTSCCGCHVNLLGQIAHCQSRFTSVPRPRDYHVTKWCDSGWHLLRPVAVNHHGIYR